MTAEGERAAFAARLEQLATVTQVTLATVLRVVEARQSGALTQPQQEVLATVRRDVDQAIQAIDAWNDSDEPAPPGQEIDLEGLKQRLGSILTTIDRACARGGGEPAGGAEPASGN